MEEYLLLLKALAEEEGLILAGAMRPPLEGGWEAVTPTLGAVKRPP